MKTAKGSDLMGESPRCTLFFFLPSQRQKKTLFFLQVSKPFSVTAALMLLLSSFPRHHCIETRRFQPYVASNTPSRLYQVQNITEGLIAAAVLDFGCLHWRGVTAPGGCFVSGSLARCYYLKLPLFVLLPEIQVRIYVYLFEQKE